MMNHMADSQISDQELLCYLDEMLNAEQMASVEKQLRASENLRNRTAGLASRRDSGVHSVGEIWRQHRLSCPSRSQLGSFLLGTLDSEMAEYLDFHIRTVGCRICSANLADLEQSREASAQTANRRRKFFQSSAGYLKRGK